MGEFFEKIKTTWHKVKFMLLVSMLIGVAIGAFAHNYYTNMRLNEANTLKAIVINDVPYNLVPR